MWNLFDKLWGPFVYTEVAQANDLLAIVPGQWPDDEYDIEWDVVSTFKRRVFGPKWIQRPRLVAHTADWYCADGIRIRNGAGLQGKTFRGSVEIADPNDWRYQACELLEEWVIVERDKHDFKPPIGRIESAEMSDQGLVVMGQIWDPEVREDISSDFSIGGTSLLRFAEGDAKFSEEIFNQQVKKGKFIYRGDEGVQIDVKNDTPIYDELKEKTDD